MSKEKQQRYFQMAIGRSGFLFIALAVLRLQNRADDGLGHAMGLVGFLFAIQYMRYTEKKAGFPKKEVNIATAVFAAAFVILSFPLLF
ncbi:hypothetical protein [Thalassobacillus pellis]|uniref:hypothetical protein n=1 Tax=Thalassobacillus pellis TaxID=748008 RepID=UPI001961DDAB|nr:hypothetical protein [Thalassobacillus pellis]MBM7553078.1 hypothetical protein [Thalassobacillus pellis]